MHSRRSEICDEKVLFAFTNLQGLTASRIDSRWLVEGVPFPASGQHCTAFDRYRFCESEALLFLSRCTVLIVMRGRVDKVKEAPWCLKLVRGRSFRVVSFSRHGLLPPGFLEGLKGFKVISHFLVLGLVSSGYERGKAISGEMPYQSVVGTKRVCCRSFVHNPELLRQQIAS
jgi:hypothetical protein